jgi:hypothetical protein
VTKLDRELRAFDLRHGFTSRGSRGFRLRRWWHEHWHVYTYRCVECGAETKWTNARKPADLLMCGLHPGGRIMALVTDK